MNVLCTNHNINGVRCGPANLPLTPDVISTLAIYAGQTGADVSPTLPGDARDLISANGAYVNATVNLDGAKSSLASAQAKRADLDKAPDPLDVAQSQAGVSSAEASLTTAKSKQDELGRGPTSFDVELAQPRLERLVGERSAGRVGRGWRERCRGEHEPTGELSSTCTGRHSVSFLSWSTSGGRGAHE